MWGELWVEGVVVVGGDVQQRVFAVRDGGVVWREFAGATAAGSGVDFFVYFND